MFDSQTKKFCSAVVDALPSLLENIMQKWIGNPKGLQKILAEVFGPKWTEKDGMIYFSVTSDGTSGPDWITRLEGKGFQLSKWTKDVLNSSDFRPSPSGTTHNCAVLRGELFSDENRITKKIRAEAGRRKFGKPNAEVACLIRENFSDDEIKAMGLWWLVTMHEPINDSVGGPDLLGARRYDVGRRLYACYDGPGNRWAREVGFVFVSPQV
jgi:hypothetical protein